MKIGALCYTMNYLCEVLQFEGSWGIAFSVLGSIIGGFGAALLWVCYGVYIKNLCRANNE
jgi:hypothetical protein